MRLGEYNIETKQDCMPSKTATGLIQKCADPVVELGVEKIIIHPQYNDTLRDKHHDVALLRLNKIVSYSKYIKPICLPIVGLNSGLITGNKLTVSGWGSTNGMHLFTKWTSKSWNELRFHSQITYFHCTHSICKRFKLYFFANKKE